MDSGYVEEIVLNNFRNYSHEKFGFVKHFNFIVGENGLGKTNLLEALSLFSNSRGIRSANPEELTRLEAGKIAVSKNLPLDVRFSLFLKLNDGDQLLLLQKAERRIFEHNGSKLKNLRELADIVKITYFSPRMDNFFIGTSADRRKFLDRTADLFFTGHYDNVRRYEVLLRERMRILIAQNHNDRWLDVVERKIVELGVSIASIRNEVLLRLNDIYNTHTTEFPPSTLSLLGEAEKLLGENKAVEVEQYYEKTLWENRLLDRDTKKTNFGIHRSDLIVWNRIKNLPANLCSTGEQKLLLLSLLLVRVIFSKRIGRAMTLFLLDEVCSHMDKNACVKLFCELKKLNVQTFMTGLSADEFGPLAGEEESNFISLK